MSESDDEKDEDYELPLESLDDLFFRTMSHVHFDPDATIDLPSGRVISGREAQAFIAAFNHRDLGFGSQHDPYDRLDKDVVESYLTDPELRERAKKAAREASWSNEVPNPVYISSRPRNPFIRMYRWLRDLRRR
ncbi:MAG TPA: hypothetical protein VF281_00955 [Candidatus Saccharimonadales bacterium]